MEKFKKQILPVLSVIVSIVLCFFVVKNLFDLSNLKTDSVLKSDALKACFEVEKIELIQSNYIKDPLSIKKAESCLVKTGESPAKFRTGRSFLDVFWFTVLNLVFVGLIVWLMVHTLGELGTDVKVRDRVIMASYTMNVFLVGIVMTQEKALNSDIKINYLAPVSIEKTK